MTLPQPGGGFRCRGLHRRRPHAADPTGARAGLARALHAAAARPASTRRRVRRRDNDDFPTPRRRGPRASTYGSSALEQDAVGVFTLGPGAAGLQEPSCAAHPAAPTTRRPRTAEFCRTAALHECMTREDAARQRTSTSTPRKASRHPRRSAGVVVRPAYGRVAGGSSDATSRVRRRGHGRRPRRPSGTRSPRARGRPPRGVLRPGRRRSDLHRADPEARRPARRCPGPRRGPAAVAKARRISGTRPEPGACSEGTNPRRKRPVSVGCSGATAGLRIPVDPGEVPRGSGHRGRRGANVRGPRRAPDAVVPALAVGLPGTPPQAILRPRGCGRPTCSSPGDESKHARRPLMINVNLHRLTAPARASSRLRPVVGGFTRRDSLSRGGTVSSSRDPRVVRVPRRERSCSRGDS